MKEDNQFKSSITSSKKGKVYCPRSVPYENDMLLYEERSVEKMSKTRFKPNQDVSSKTRI